MVIKLYHNSRRMSNKLLGQKRVAIDLQKKILHISCAIDLKSMFFSLNYNCSMFNVTFQNIAPLNSII